MIQFRWYRRKLEKHEDAAVLRDKTHGEPELQFRICEFDSRGTWPNQAEPSWSHWQHIPIIKEGEDKK